MKEEILEILSRIDNDALTPRNIKQKIQEVQAILNSPDENLALKINKVLQELDELGEENNVPEHIRTQIWNMVSLLESIN